MEKKENLERILKEQKWGIKQRASQISQMEMVIREHQSDTTSTIKRLEKAVAESAEEAKKKEKTMENAWTRVKEKEGIIAELKKSVQGVNAEKVLLLGETTETFWGKYFCSIVKLVICLIFQTAFNRWKRRWKISFRQSAN